MRTYLGIDCGTQGTKALLVDEQGKALGRGYAKHALIERPWLGAGDPTAQAEVKADAAFELFRVLDLPFYCFHDADMAPAGDTLQETLRHFHTMAEYLAGKMTKCMTKLLWERRICFRIRGLWRGLRRILIRMCLRGAQRSG